MITKNSKEKIIQSLLITKQKAHTLEIRLLMSGKTAEATKISLKSKNLTRQIDNLLAAVMQEWLGQNASVINTIKGTNTKLQKTITNIKNKVKVTENIVKVVGLIDDAIDTAKGLLA